MMPSTAHRRGNLGLCEMDRSPAATVRSMGRYAINGPAPRTYSVFLQDRAGRLSNSHRCNGLARRTPHWPSGRFAFVDLIGLKADSVLKRWHACNVICQVRENVAVNAADTQLMTSTGCSDLA